VSAGGGLSDDAYAFVLQEVAQPTPEEIVVVDDQNADLGQLLIVRLYELAHSGRPRGPTKFSEG